MLKTAYLNNRSKSLKGIFQKDGDVQLAIDLVSRAYQNSFDVAIICSEDVNLLESIKLIKILGKKAIPSLISNVTGISRILNQKLENEAA